MQVSTATSIHQSSPDVTLSGIVPPPWGPSQCAHTQTSPKCQLAAGAWAQTSPKCQLAVGAWVPALNIRSAVRFRSYTLAHTWDRLLGPSFQTGKIELTGQAKRFARANKSMVQVTNLHPALTTLCSRTPIPTKRQKTQMTTFHADIAIRNFTTRSDSVHFLPAASCPLNPLAKVFSTILSRYLLATLYARKRKRDRERERGWQKEGRREEEEPTQADRAEPPPPPKKGQGH